MRRTSPLHSAVVGRWIVILSGQNAGQVAQVRDVNRRRLLVRIGGDGDWRWIKPNRARFARPNEIEETCRAA